MYLYVDILYICIVLMFVYLVLVKSSLVNLIINNKLLVMCVCMKCFVLMIIKFIWMMDLDIYIFKGICVNIFVFKKKKI